MPNELVEKYGLDLSKHMAGGDDLDWDGGTNDRLNEILTSACVSAIETTVLYPNPGPGLLGITYPEGFCQFLVVLRAVAKDPEISRVYDDPTRPCGCTDWKGAWYHGYPTTRVHKVLDWWVTATCYGSAELRDLLTLAQPHPDDEENNR